MNGEQKGGSSGPLPGPYHLGTSRSVGGGLISFRISTGYLPDFAVVRIDPDSVFSEKAYPTARLLANSWSMLEALFLARAVLVRHGLGLEGVFVASAIRNAVDQQESALPSSINMLEAAAARLDDVYQALWQRDPPQHIVDLANAFAPGAARAKAELPEPWPVMVEFDRIQIISGHNVGPKGGRIIHG